MVNDTDTKILRVLLVDDHILFRSGVKAELHAYPDLMVVGEASNGLEAIRLTCDTHPDVILMDINMPRCSGMEAIEVIKREFPEVRIIMLTVFDDDEHLFEAIKRGADGYLLKSIEPGELLDMLSRVRCGEAAVDGKIAARVLNRIRKTETPADGAAIPREPLTSREIEVLQLLVEGESNSEIAHHLIISENTVKMHLTNILTKLHLQNRIQAAVYAVQNGLVEVAPTPIH